MPARGRLSSLVARQFAAWQGSLGAHRLSKSCCRTGRKVGWRIRLMRLIRSIHSILACVSWNEWNESASGRGIGKVGCEKSAGSVAEVAIVLKKREKAWVFGDSRWPSLVGHVAIWTHGPDMVGQNSNFSFASVLRSPNNRSRSRTLRCKS